MLRRLTRHGLRITAILLAVYLILILVVFGCQRSMLFFPTHTAPSSSLTPWFGDQRKIGYCREVPNANTIWLMMHGNAGQAADREYVLNRMSNQDSLYVLEYPGMVIAKGFQVSNR